MERSRAEQHRLKRNQKRKSARSLLALSAVVAICAAGITIWTQGDFGGGSAASDTSLSADSASPSPKSEGGVTSTPPAGTPDPSGTPAPSSNPSAKPSAAPSMPASTSPAAAPAIGGPGLKMAFVGDVIFASTVETVLKKNGYDYPYQDLKEILLKPDITAANLETPITVRGEEQKKEYTYRSHPDALQAFLAAGFDVVNTANNHIMDYGAEGLLDTLRHLDAAEIKRVGTGRNIDEAYKHVVMEKNGIKVAFLGFSQEVPDNSWKAGAKTPGTTQIYDLAPEKPGRKLSRAQEAIKSARKDADLVVVFAHWGVERQDRPTEAQRNEAKIMIDSGADLIIGTHPHVLQGFEQYKGKWIAYSLGNFLFTTNTVPATWETVVLQAECSRTADCKLSVVPVLNKYAHPVRMEQTESLKLFERLSGISYGARVNSEGQVSSGGG